MDRFSGGKSITEPTDYARNIAFLAGVATLFSTNEKVAQIDASDLINPAHWVYLAKIYYATRSQLLENYDENQYQIKKIIESSKPYLGMVDAIRQKEFFNDLFKACETVYDEILKIWDSSIEEEKKAINELLKKKYPNETEIKIDLRDSYQDIMNLFKSKIPKPTSVGISVKYGLGITEYGTLSIDNTYFSHLVGYLTPQMNFLINLGIASVSTSIANQISGELWEAPGDNRGTQYLSYTLENNQSLIARTEYTTYRVHHLVDSTAVRCDAIWRNRRNINTSKTDILESVQKSAEEKALAVIKEHRKSIATLFLKSTELAFSKLDALLKLLPAYCHIAGFKPEDIKAVGSLTSSKDFIKQMTDYSESKDASVVLVNLTWSNSLKETKESLLKNIESKGYFNNTHSKTHYNDIVALIELIETLPGIDQHRASIKSSNTRDDCALKLDQLADSFINIIETWNAFYPKEWLKQFEKSIPSSLYEKYIKQYDELSLYHNLFESELKGENASHQAIFTLMGILHTLLFRQHRDLKLISQKYAKSDSQKYLISDNETGLPGQEEFNSIMKLIQDKSSKQSEVIEVKKSTSKSIAHSDVGLFSSSTSSGSTSNSALSSTTLTSNKSEMKL